MNPRAWQIEEKFVPETVSEAGELQARLVEQGESVAVASGIVGWIVWKTVNDTDPLPQTTKSAYRKALAKLALSSPPTERGNLPRRNSGIAQTALVAA